MVFSLVDKLLCYHASELGAQLVVSLNNFLFLLTKVYFEVKIMDYFERLIVERINKGEK